MLVNTNEPFELKDVIRDFKKFTSKKILSQIQNEPESRREWMLNSSARNYQDMESILKIEKIGQMLVTC